MTAPQFAPTVLTAWAHSSSMADSGVGAPTRTAAVSRASSRGSWRASSGETNVFDVDAVDFLYLGDQEVDQLGARELDDELVDGPVGPSLEDVDPDDVAPDGTDPTGEGAQCTRPVRHPDPNDVGRRHGGDRTGFG